MKIKIKLMKYYKNFKIKLIKNNLKNKYKLNKIINNNKINKIIKWKIKKNKWKFYNDLYIKLKNL